MKRVELSSLDVVEESVDNGTGFGCGSSCVGIFCGDSCTGIICLCY